MKETEIVLLPSGAPATIRSALRHAAPHELVELKHHHGFLLLGTTYAPTPSRSTYHDPPASNSTFFKSTLAPEDCSLCDRSTTLRTRVPHQQPLVKENRDPQNTSQANANKQTSTAPSAHSAHPPLGTWLHLEAHHRHHFFGHNEIR